MEVNRKGKEMVIKEKIYVEKLINRFEDMAEKGTLLAGANVTQEDLLIQIVGTIVVEAMSENG